MNLDLLNLEGFDWNVGNLEHIKKHNISKEECEEIFVNRPLILTPDTGHSNVEERIRALGRTNKGKLLVLIFTIRGNKVRIITARAQNRREKTEYQPLGGDNL